MLSGLADISVRIEYANMATMNRIRAWARRNNASVKVERYARDAYSGAVVVHSPWNESRETTIAKAEAVREIIRPAKVGA